MSIYDFSSYKKFFNDWVEKQPKKGHGEYRRVSQSLGVSTTLISQVFKGDKELSLELACDLGEYLNLSEGEAEYFLLLVEFSKAGSVKLKKRFERQILARQEKAKQIENRVKKEFDLSSEAKAIFYSSWIYSAVRLSSAIEGLNDVVSISQHLNLPRNQVQKVLEFLLDHQLCFIEDGKVRCSTLSTHIGASSLLVNKHHQNWRIQGFQKMVQQSQESIFYSHPMVISKSAREEIRSQILDFIEKVRKISGPSDSEELICLNIDWFDV